MAHLRLAAAVIAASVLIGMPADTKANDQKVDFEFDRAELSSSGGLAKLLDRIDAHAKSKCSMLSNPSRRNPKAKECSQDVANQLISKINAPALTEASKARAR